MKPQKLFDYVKTTFENGVELFLDKQVYTNDKGITLTRDTRRLREMSLGLISSNNATEWHNICRLNCVPGTIIEPYEDKWDALYQDMLILARNALLRALLSERDKSSAKTLLTILERRDTAKWSQNKDKQISIDAKDMDKSININIVSA